MNSLQLEKGLCGKSCCDDAIGFRSAGGISGRVRSVMNKDYSELSTFNNSSPSPTMLNNENKIIKTFFDLATCLTERQYCVILDDHANGRHYIVCGISFPRPKKTFKVSHYTIYGVR